MFQYSFSKSISQRANRLTVNYLWRKVSAPARGVGITNWPSISYALFFALEYSSVNAQVMEMKGVTQLNDTGILTIVFIVQ